MKHGESEGALALELEKLVWVVTPSLDNLYDFNNSLHLSGSWFPFPYNSDSSRVVVKITYILKHSLV